MTPYFDTGLLVKAYVEEPGSPIADALLSACDVPVAFTALHALEFRNALQLKRFRREMTDDEVAGVLLALQDDIADGRLSRPPLDLEAVFTRAERLSAKHAATTGARSLDILHVAAAGELGSPAFASLDLRQRTLARRANFKVLPARAGSE